MSVNTFPSSALSNDLANLKSIIDSRRLQSNFKSIGRERVRFMSNLCECWFMLFLLPRTIRYSCHTKVSYWGKRLNVQPKPILKRCREMLLSENEFRVYPIKSKLVRYFMAKRDCHLFYCPNIAENVPELIVSMIKRLKYAWVAWL